MSRLSMKPYARLVAHHRRFYFFLPRNLSSQKQDLSTQRWAGPYHEVQKPDDRPTGLAYQGRPTLHVSSKMVDTPESFSYV